MSIYKKDYVAIAAIIKAERDSADTWLTSFQAVHNDIHSQDAADNDNIAHARKTCADRLAAQMAEYFTQQNPHFRRQQFLTACGVTL